MRSTNPCTPATPWLAGFLMGIYKKICLWDWSWGLYVDKVICDWGYVYSWLWWRPWVEHGLWNSPSNQFWNTFHRSNPYLPKYSKPTVGLQCLVFNGYSRVNVLLSFQSHATKFKCLCVSWFRNGLDPYVELYVALAPNTFWVILDDPWEIEYWTSICMARVTEFTNAYHLCPCTQSITYIYIPLKSP